MYYFFFFKEEEGIRDSSVTGVQTCALPIGCGTPASTEDTVSVMHLVEAGVPQRYPKMKIVNSHLGGMIPMVLQRLDNIRSEERRVGEECRSRWSPYH